MATRTSPVRRVCHHVGHTVVGAAILTIAILSLLEFHELVELLRYLVPARPPPGPRLRAAPLMPFFIEKHIESSDSSSLLRCRHRHIN